MQFTCKILGEDVTTSSFYGLSETLTMGAFGNSTQSVLNNNLFKSENSERNPDSTRLN